MLDTVKLLSGDPVNKLSLDLVTWIRMWAKNVCIYPWSLHRHKAA